MEDKKSFAIAVLTAIKKNGGNLSFNELEKLTGLSFVELSTVIGLLLKESQLLIHPNPAKVLQSPYKPNKEYLCGRFFRLLYQYHVQERSVTF